jgi:drug/metabolite transporter (DMT)-like permease
MAEQAKPTDNRNMHASILIVIGVILLIAGVAIVSIPGAPMRGSGLGTIAILAGIVLLAIALVRFRQKPKI